MTTRVTSGPIHQSNAFDDALMRLTKVSNFCVKSLVQLSHGFHSPSKLGNLHFHSAFISSTVVHHSKRPINLLVRMNLSSSITAPQHFRQLRNNLYHYADAEQHIEYAYGKSTARLSELLRPPEPHSDQMRPRHSSSQFKTHTMVPLMHCFDGQGETGR